MIFFSERTILYWHENAVQKFNALLGMHSFFLKKVGNKNRLEEKDPIIKNYSRSVKEQSEHSGLCPDTSTLVFSYFLNYSKLFSCEDHAYCSLMCYIIEWDPRDLFEIYILNIVQSLFPEYALYISAKLLNRSSVFWVIVAFIIDFIKSSWIR